MLSETKKTTFLFQLKEYGIYRFIFSYDFLIGVFVFLILRNDLTKGLGNFAHPEVNYVIALFAAASTLFAITLASLAIILSFSSSQFTIFLRKHGKFSRLLFHFWVGNLAYLFVISLSTIYLLLDRQKLNQFINGLLYPLIISMFIYAVLATFYILATVIRFGNFLDLFEKIKGRE